MARIYPSWSSASLTHSSLNHVSPHRTSFTIWMKSLVFNGNGCTAFDSGGQIAYRVDNYDLKCQSEVYLMDTSGKLLFKILKKKLRVFGRWEGYSYNYDSQKEERNPRFMVKKPCRVLKGGQPISCCCEVWDDTGRVLCCKMKESANSAASSYNIVGFSGELLAEVKRKESKSGVGLGDDVLTLIVEPNIDQSLIMALVVVHGLMNCRM